MRETYDYVIVGAGSAGCVLASRLTEDPTVTVLLVESGPPDTNPFIAMPMGLGKLRKPGNPHYWSYAVSLGGNRGEEVWVKGRTLGGSSSINGMVYVRGTPADYDRWEAGGCPGWGWDTIGRCFVELEDHELGPAQWRGVGGPLHVSMPVGRNPLSEAVLSAAAALGTPTVVDINDPAACLHGGFGYQPRTIKRGARFSAANAFLRPAAGRPNLDVLTDTDVLAIEFEGLRATGVKLRAGSGERVVAAQGEVILTAGAIHTPQLLQLAGIGPPALLASLGIPVRVEAPEVGRNLCEHRTLPMRYRLKQGGLNPRLRGPGLIFSALRYALGRRGPLAGAFFDVGGFVKTLPGLDVPDGQIGVGLFTAEPDGVSSFSGLTMFGYFMRPESRGELAIQSVDPLAPPRIDANYMAAQADRVHAVALMRYIRKIVAQPVLAPYIAEEITPGADCTSDEDLLEATFKYGTSGYHIAGTCRMGSDDKAVLDPELRVRGVSGLRVADTSMMPDLVSGNTNGPAMAIAWRAAELIRENRTAVSGQRTAA